MKLRASDMRILEKVFQSEIDGRPLHQMRDSKAVLALEAAGLIMRAEFTMGGRGQLAVLIKGWVFTDRGHLIFCENCRDVADD